MRRRSWISALEFGLLLSLTPACSHQVIVAPGDGVPAHSASPSITYGERSRTPTLAMAPRPTVPLPIEQAGFPGSTVSRRPEQRPDALPEAPGPARELPQSITAPVPAPQQAKLRPAEESALVAALRSFQNKQPAEAVACLDRYDKPNQDFLLVLLPLAARLTELDLQRLSAQEATVLTGQLQGLLGPLRTLANLSIAKVCFCRSIDTFGVYEPLADNHAFRPGEPVQVYVELHNFSSVLQGKVYVTRLASWLEILEYNGKVVWSSEFPDREHSDLSKSMRHDYFSSYRFCVPEELRPGPYTLRLRVKEVSTGRTAERTLDFRVTTVPPRAS